MFLIRLPGLNTFHSGSESCVGSVELIRIININMTTNSESFGSSRVREEKSLSSESTAHGLSLEMRLHEYKESQIRLSSDEDFGKPRQVQGIT